MAKATEGQEIDLTDTTQQRHDHDDDDAEAMDVAEATEGRAMDVTEAPKELVPEVGSATQAAAAAPAVPRSDIAAAAARTDGERLALQAREERARQRAAKHMAEERQKQEQKEARWQEEKIRRYKRYGLDITAPASADSVQPMPDVSPVAQRREMKAARERREKNLKDLRDRMETADKNYQAPPPEIFHPSTDAKRCTLGEIGIAFNVKFENFERQHTKPICEPHNEWHRVARHVNATLHANFKDAAAAGQLTHVISGCFTIDKLKSGQTLETIDGQKLTVALPGKGSVQFFTAEGVVLEASANMHASDGVAYIFGSAHKTGALDIDVKNCTSMKAAGTLAQALEDSKDLSDSAKSAVATKLAAVQSDCKCTVLVPSRVALTMLDAHLLDQLVAQSPAAGLQPKQLSRWQVLTAFQLIQKPGLIAAWDVGMGKTLLAVFSALLLIFEGLVERAVFVVPKSVKRNFEDALQEVGTERLLRAMEGQARSAADSLTNEYMHVCTIHEIMSNYPNMMSLDGEAREADRLRAKELFGGAFLVIDEAHNLRTLPKSNISDGCHTGVRTAVMMRLSQLAERRLLMTATPVPNKPKDLLTLAVIAQGGNQILSERELAACVQVSDHLSHYLLPSLAERAKRLQTIFGDTISFLRRAPEVTERRAIGSLSKPVSSKAKIPSASAFVNSRHVNMSEFPTVNYEDIVIRMTKEEAKEYRRGIAKMQAEASAKAAERGSDRFANDAFHHQKRGQSNLTGGKKVQAIREAIQANPKRRFMVYSNFKEWGCDLVKREFDNHGITYRIITGQTSKDDRNRAVNDVNHGRVDGIILSPAGGEGLDLKGIRLVFVVDDAWNTSVLTQSVGRAVRRGSHNEYQPADQTVTVHRTKVIFPEGDSEQTGDDVVESIRDAKETHIAPFVRRLLEACDPLRTDDDD